MAMTITLGGLRRLSYSLHLLLLVSKKGGTHVERPTLSLNCHQLLLLCTGKESDLILVGSSQYSLFHLGDGVGLLAGAAYKGVGRTCDAAEQDHCDTGRDGIDLG